MKADTPRKVVLATGNRGKLTEMQAILAGHALEVIAQSELGIEPPEETGDTFVANALQKARHASRLSGLPAIADDSGLEVDARDGKPGVHSARWAEMHSAGKGDAANNALLVCQREGVPNAKRTARFVCVLALASPDGSIVLAKRAKVSPRPVEDIIRILRDRGYRASRAHYSGTALKTDAPAREIILALSEKRVFPD